MKRLGILALVAVAIYVAWAVAYPTYTHRYRLTIEVDTPEGVRSGSSVIEVTRNDARLLRFGGAQYIFKVRGEAVFIDLGAGRNVIGLLAMGAYAQFIDPLISLAIEAYGYDKWDEDAWAGRRPLQGPVELKPPFIPTLVAFSDLSDPKTVRVVYAADVRESAGPRRQPYVAVDRLAEFLGPGVRFERARLEATRDDVTRTIEQKLPWIAQMKSEGFGTRIDGEPGRFRLNVPYFTRAD